MLSHFELLVRFISAALELPMAAGGAGAIILVGVIGIAGGAVVLCARSVLAVVGSVFGMAPRGTVTEPSDVSELLSQSDPDADGRPRPRAPGLPSAVAAR